MSLTYGFYNSKNHDRMYTALQVSQIFDGLISDGVYESYGKQLTVKLKKDRIILVQEGRAWFNHTWTLNDTAYELTIDAPDTLYSRWDTVILEVNTDDMVRKNSLKVLRGIPASNPSKPSLINSGSIHQYPLAHINVEPNKTALSESDIQNVVGSSECPFVKTVMKTATLTDVYSKYEAAYQEMVTSKTTEFENWFTSLQTNLTGDQAAKIWAYIILKPSFKTLLNEFGISTPNDASLIDILNDIVIKLNNFRTVVQNIQINKEDCYDLMQNIPYKYGIRVPIEKCTSNHIADIYLPKNIIIPRISSICDTNDGYITLYTNDNEFESFTIPYIILELTDF